MDGAGSDRLCGVKDGLRSGGSLVERLAHARVLCALSRKDECYFTHLLAPVSSCSASPNISSMISLAG